VVDEARSAEYETVIGAIAAWARARDDVRAVGVVGSWARRRARMDSDIDVVILTGDKARYLGDDAWIVEVLGRTSTVIRRQEWGVLTERRVRLPSGLEVELGLVTPTWASTAPLDPGTEAVVRRGCLAIVDPDSLLSRLLAEVHRRAAPTPDP
jgi:predicted nucleotidyltransferase